MNTVWLLHHVHEFKDGSEDIKLIGVFETSAQAQAAKESVMDQPGFRELPDGFTIEAHRLGLIAWKKGYVTIAPVKT